MNKNYILVKGQIGHDELDLEFVGVFSKVRWKVIKDKTEVAFAHYGGQFDLFFGVNESIPLHSYDHWLKQLKVVEIAEYEGMRMIELLGDDSYGTGKEYFFAYEQIQDAL